MIEFTAVVLIIVVILAVISYRHYGMSKPFKNIAYGLLIAPLAALAVAFILGNLISCSTVDRVEVFAGIERTKKLSPQCKSGGASDKITSNLGVSACKEIGGGTDICASYRHHSCAISEDREQYDAFGFEARKVFQL